MRSFVYAVLALLFTLSEAKASVSLPTLLDKPLSLTVIPLSSYGGASSSEGTSSYFTLTCYYYPEFMVKEIITDQKGAHKISITPSSSQNPMPCIADDPKEQVVNHSGYFLGIKNSFLFFRGDDSHNGASGITILTSQGDLLFEDGRGNLLENRKPSTITVEKEGTLMVHYTRFFEAPCSLFGKSKDQCWSTIKKETGLQGPRSNCPTPEPADYYKSKEGQAYMKKSPTVVEYQAVGRITSYISTIQPEPITQKNIHCQPSV